MQEFSRPLGDVVKRARGELNLTQAQVAGRIDKDTRTIMNIENYNSRPFPRHFHISVQNLTQCWGFS